jgi:nicotinamidase-related amidase
MSDTALLIMDVQQGIVDRFPAAEAVLRPLARAAAAARARGVPVIHVRVAFRPGAPEIDRANPIFAAVADRPGIGIDDPGTAVHPAVGPEPGDLEVIKKRVSAFAGSDLDTLLRGLGVRSLVLGGITTSGVVLSTVRQAADADFRLTVLRDGCADADDEVQRVLLEKVFPRQAAVVTADEWAAAR